jgi:hypothetical protein
MWTHIGRVWTNGEQFLLMDRFYLHAWQADESQVDTLTKLDWSVTTTDVGWGTAAIVATDGTVCDEGWLEVFKYGRSIAVVQAMGAPYRRALGKALEYPVDDDHVGDVISVPSGDVFLFSSALSGDGEWPEGVPGVVPAEYEPAHSGFDPPTGLHFPLPRGDYRLYVRWMTELGDETCFARWVLSPEDD